MDTNVNPLFQMNSTTIDIYVEPADGRHRVNGFDLSTLNLTWTVTEYVDDQLKL
jgi:hypothetical protein